MTVETRREHQDRENHRKRLGKIVKHLRAEAGLTRRELGRRAKFPDATIRRIEQGTTLMTRAQWERLTQTPALARLAQCVAQEGIKVEFEGDPQSTGEGK